MPDGSAALIYRVREKPWGPVYLRAGLNFEAIPTMSSNSLTALVGIRASRLNALGAEWATQLQLGEESGFRTEFYQPLEFDAGWFVAPSVLYNSGRLPIFDGEDRIAEIDVHAEAIRADLGHVFGQYGELRLGVERSWSNIDQRTGTVPEHIAVYLDETIDRGALVLTGTVDRLDDAKLPKHGWLIQLDASQSFDSLGNEGGEYYRAELRANRFWTRGRNTLFGAIAGGVSGDEPLPPYDRFLLGGFFSFTGFEYGELSGDNYGLARAGYLYQLTKSFHVGGMLEAARVEDRRLPGDPSDDTLEREVSAATALVVVDSPAGPLYLAFGGSPEGRTSAYIVFGRRF